MDKILASRASGFVTERAIIFLVPDANIEDPSHPAGKVFKNLLHVVEVRPGFLGGHWAMRIGSENEVQQLVDWDCMQSYENVINDNELMEPLMRELLPIMRADPPIYHIYYQSGPSLPSTGGGDGKAAAVIASSFLSKKAPITELTELYLVPSISLEEMSKLEVMWHKYADEIVQKADGCVFVAQGWVLEELESSKEEVGKTKVFHIAVGWESADKQTLLNESEAEKEFQKKLEKYVVHFESSSFKWYSNAELHNMD